MKAQAPTFNEGYQGVEKPFGLNVVSLMPKEFVSTVGQMAQVRLAQLEVQTRMEATLGRQVDPRNVDDATAFFDAFAKDKPLAPVAVQYESYLKAFYKHSGADVGWTDTIPADQRGARVGELFDGLPSDEAGRTLVDCEGFSYLTAHILGGVKDETGKPRLDVLYATRPDHVITGVLDQGTKQAFTVNNDAVSAPTAVGNALEVQRLIGQALAGSDANIIGIATTQSESWPQVNHDKHQPPQLGALVWDGKKVVGQITAQSQAAFIQFSRDNGTESYSAFVKWSLKQ